MKIRLFIVILTLMMALSVSAQKLTIDGGLRATNEITASQYPRMDANNHPCALLKVEVVDAITKVEGGVVGNVVDNGTEKWVYFEGGQKTFRLHFANHLPVTINYDEGLKANNTYMLILVENSANWNTVVDEDKQFLVMNVQPKNATVLVNGEMQSVDADGVVTAYLPYGTYSYRVMAVGYKEKNGTFTIGREKTTLNVTLVSAMATLKVSCATLNAEIYVNGSLKGKGSWQGQLAAGTYSLEAKCPGYRSSSTSVTLAANDSRSVSIPALSLINGAIKVNYSPTNAEVWLDGKKLGTSPDVFRNVGIGSHRLQIKKDGYVSKTLNVTVAEGMVTNIQGSLIKQTSASSISEFSSSLKQNSPFRTFTIKGVSFNMIKVDGGTFTMGANVDDSEAEAGEIRHQVTLSDYFIGETEVTQALWKAVMGYNPSKYKGDNRPVEHVSWDECQEFIRKLNLGANVTFCLPTEAEWEFAARGGNKSCGYKYSGSDNIDDVAWYRTNSENKTHVVGTKQVNELGLFDMCGNVCEWCSDLYGKYEMSLQKNPSGSSTGLNRVNRGGTWQDNSKFCRVSYRCFNMPTSSHEYLGFRLAIH